MRKSRLLAKIRDGKVAQICSLGHFLPFFVRYAAYYEYDAIWLDLEHRAMGEREVQALLAFCRLYDIDCMVRPPTIERNHLYRYLEDGASGFLIPFVSDRETAHKIVEAVKFPPLGNRGIDGVGLDTDFGMQPEGSGGDYTNDANKETFVVAQIETPEAVIRADEVASVPGIDALFVGSADLGLRLSASPESRIQNLSDAVNQVSAAALRHGKAWGAASGSLDNLAAYRKMGAQILAWGSDFYLSKALRDSSLQLARISD